MKNLYSDKYFLNRNFNDPKRIKSFKVEDDFISRYVDKKNKVCDIGCSTGEFLVSINWSGSKYGMELNTKAKKLAEKRNINFQHNILNKKNFFDVVIMRGVIQHLDEPFKYIKHSYTSLKKGGLLIFLATPNIGSIYYRLFQSLPALDDKTNLYLPSKRNLISVCKIYNFKLVDYQTNYLRSGYANILKDYSNFILKCLFLSKIDTPFPGNMMNLIFKK